MRTVVSKCIQRQSSIDLIDLENIAFRNKPSETLWQRVLPSFPEYLAKFEEICERKLSIPKEELDEELEFKFI